MKQNTERLVYTVEQVLDSGAFSSRNKFYAAIARGELRTFRDGKRRMTTAGALQEYIAQRERATAEGNAADSVPTPMSDESRERLSALNASRKHAARPRTT